jgi:hypothetical protein
MPGTDHEHHRQTVTQKMITRIYAVDRGLELTAAATSACHNGQRPAGGFGLVAVRTRFP